VNIFFEELVAITTVSTDPQILYKIVVMWNRVAGISSVRDILVSQPSIGLPTASHLLHCCLAQVASSPLLLPSQLHLNSTFSRCTQTNTHLMENLEELVEDFKTEPVVDQHVKEILSNLAVTTPSPSSPSGGSRGKSGADTFKNSSSAVVMSAEERWIHLPLSLSLHR
jgi:hypothetical protein